MACGDSCLGSLEYARALEAYEHAERLTPHAAVAPLRIALTLYRWGNAVPALRSDLWPAAMKAADRSRFLDPTGAEAVFLAAVVRYRLGDYKSAVDVYTALEMVRQGDIDLYLDLAVVASRGGDQALAIRALEKARALNPSSRRLYTVAKEVFTGR